MERYAQLGSVSSGTLRTADLLTAFADALEQLTGDYADLVREARTIDPDSEMAVFVVGDLFDALSEFAPPFAYFGAHPGDAADFGFWIDERALEDAQHDGELVVASDPPGDDVPDDCASWLYVNDHGNATLYVRNGASGWREVWSVV